MGVVRLVVAASAAWAQMQIKMFNICFSAIFQSRYDVTAFQNVWNKLVSKFISLRIVIRFVIDLTNLLFQ